MMARLKGHFYKYKFAIREASKRKTATFYCNTFSVSFTPDFIRVDYHLHNQRAHHLTIIWHKAYIVIHTDSSKLITSKVPLQKKNEPVPPLMIQPGKDAEGFVIPIDYIAEKKGVSYPLIPCIRIMMKSSQKKLTGLWAYWA
jgi:hypothetical protein